MSRHINNFLNKTRINILRTKPKEILKDNQKTFYIGQTAKEIRDEIIETHYKAICSAFELVANDHDMRLFKEATNGSGNEWMEVNQLNSSTLLAFLCFHKVSTKHRLIFNGVEYSEVHFEVQSPLSPDGRSAPVSNMDVVLLTNDHKKALFLESKFSEYLTSSKPKPKSYYPNKHPDLFVTGSCAIHYSFNGSDYTCSYKNDIWTTEPKNSKLYLEGLKQMICHYLGILHCKNTANAWQSYEYLSSSTEIKLGEIVFKFHGDEKSFPQYRAAYHELAKKLNSHAQGKLELIQDIQTYQDLFIEENSVLLDPKVKSFYFS